MPTNGYYTAGHGWKYMKVWQRKKFHRENRSRVAKGLPPLPKPPTVHPSIGV